MEPTDTAFKRAGNAHAFYITSQKWMSTQNSVVLRLHFTSLNSTVLLQQNEKKKHWSVISTHECIPKRDPRWVVLNIPSPQLCTIMCIFHNTNIPWAECDSRAKGEIAFKSMLTTSFGIQPKKQPMLSTMKEGREDMSNVGLFEDCSMWYPASLLCTDFRS